MRSLVFILAALSAVPALAEPAAPSTGGPPLDPNARICRTTQVIGTRLGRLRRCATRAQWVEFDAEQRRQTQESLRQGTQPQCMTSRQPQGSGGGGGACQ